MTAWRMPALVASAKERVEEAGASGHRVRHLLELPGRLILVDVGGVQFSGGQASQEVDADGPHERLGELVIDQGVVCLGGDCPGCGNHRGSCSNTGREVPGVVVGARHCVLLW